MARDEGDVIPQGKQLLADAVDELLVIPAGKVGAPDAALEEHVADPGNALALVQEALSQLRLDMKYPMFDLEATRRERDALKQQRDGDVG